MFREHSQRINLEDHAELLGCIPVLLGFHPSNSLAMLAMSDGNIVAVCTIALTPQGEQRDGLRSAASQTALVLAGKGVTHVVLAGYGAATPIIDAITLVDAVLEEADIGVISALRVEHGRRFHVGCAGPHCCPAQGIAFDPATTAVAAGAVMRGRVVAPDRGSLKAQLAPLTGAGTASFTIATAAAVQRLYGWLSADGIGDPAGAPTAAVPDQLRRRLLQSVRHTLTAAVARMRARQPVEDAAAAWLTVLLSLRPVRNAVALNIGSAGQGSDPWLIAVLIELLRKAETRFVPGVGNVLAVAAMVDGNNPLALEATKRVLHADPHDSFAQHLTVLLQFNTSPAEAVEVLCC